MKLITDPGNTNALKILVASELSSANLDVELQQNEGHQCLPVLELEDTTLFSPNSAVRYFYADPQGDEDLLTSLDELLEWELTQLEPVAHSMHISLAQHNKIPVELSDKLVKLLSTIEQITLNNPNGLVGVEVSAADIVVWSTIYPVFCEHSVLPDLAVKFPNVGRWFGQVLALPAVSAALSKLPMTFENIKASFKARAVRYQARPQLGENPSQASGSSAATNKAASTEVDSSITLPPVGAEEVASAETAWNSGIDSLPVPRTKPTPHVPQAGERNILITSALPYVNNVPHLGNIIGCVLSADVFARFCRLRNLNTLYICGTDEYGTATETKAMEEGVSPQQICDKYNKLHTEIYKWFNISFDYFGRTTTQQQTKIAQDIFWKLYENNYILKDSIEQLLCEHCKRFLADRFVEGICPFCAYEDARGDQCDKCGKLINAVELGDPRCKQCKNTPVVKSSDHLFMDLPSLQPLLEKHLNANFDKGIWSSNTKVITKSWIRDGLKPRCISRDLKWGTPVPLEGYTDKVFYVWYDAPIGYISITANYIEQWQSWWQNPQQVELCCFMAKDNVPFHSVIFPSTLLGTGDNWTVVNHLSATEYLNYEDGKFSKSRGVGVFGSDVMETNIPADVWRFYLLFLRPESQDSAFSWDDFMMKNNSELLNNLGNFINRGLMFVSNNFDGQIPEMVLLLEDKELLALVTKELKAYIDNLSGIRLRDGIRNILTISRYGNQYMQAHKPWVKVKGSPEDKARAGTVVGLVTNIACLLSIMVQPYMPAVSQTIQTQLNAPASCNVIHNAFVPYLLPGHKISKPSPLFQKIDASTIQDLKKRFAGQVEVTKSDDSSSKQMENLEKEVAAQGEVVRKLKAEKAEKSVITVEVNKLLDLKKQLATAQGTPAGGKQKGKQGKSAVIASEHSPAEVERLTKAVSDQANKVRQLKTEKADKGSINSEVAILLDLKKQLEAAEGGRENATVSAVPSTKSNPDEVDRLTREVTEQGEAVRKLKTEKADKSTIDLAVAKLLDLKRHLAIAQGENPDAVVGGNKKKGKK